jgi:hypothetical protein
LYDICRIFTVNASENDRSEALKHGLVQILIIRPFTASDENIFDIVFVSYGTSDNLLYKLELLEQVSDYFKLNNIYFASCETGKAHKSDILLDNVYLAIDNHAGHLSELNAPKKILLKNFKEVDWNETPINDENTYVANSFKDIEDMIDFDLKLKDMGVFLNA